MEREKKTRISKASEDERSRDGGRRKKTRRKKINKLNNEKNK